MSPSLGLKVLQISLFHIILNLIRFGTVQILELDFVARQNSHEHVRIPVRDNVPVLQNQRFVDPDKRPRALSHVLNVISFPFECVFYQQMSVSHSNFFQRKQYVIKNLASFDPNVSCANIHTTVISFPLRFWVPACVYCKFGATFVTLALQDHDNQLRGTFDFLVWYNGAEQGDIVHCYGTLMLLCVGVYFGRDVELLSGGLKSQFRSRRWDPTPYFTWS